MVVVVASDELVTKTVSWGSVVVVDSVLVISVELGTCVVVVVVTFFVYVVVPLIVLVLVTGL